MKTNRFSSNRTCILLLFFPTRVLPTFFFINDVYKKNFWKILTFPIDVLAKLQKRIHIALCVKIGASLFHLKKKRKMHLTALRILRKNVRISLKRQQLRNVSESIFCTRAWRKNRYTDSLLMLRHWSVCGIIVVTAAVLLLADHEHSHDERISLVNFTKKKPCSLAVAAVSSSHLINQQSLRRSTRF